MSGRAERVFGTTQGSSQVDAGEHWLSVSDLMAGLMMVFLFVSIALMREAMAERDKVQVERDKIKDVAVAYQENQVTIYDALMDEFNSDLSRWGAEVDKETLSFNFKSPEVLFASGETDLKPGFRSILDDFFPRYMGVLDRFRSSIDEVRIEGHTSSIWNQRTPADEAYFKNMWLSQGRTRAVLAYVHALPESDEQRDWIRRRVSAVGFSSSRPVLTSSGKEDRERSRRVLFRVITNAETQIRKIIGS